MKKRKNLPIADNATLLKRRVSHWGLKLKVNPKVIRVQHMTRKWGSCSRNGIITLAQDLCEKDHKFQDFVIVHELLHFRIETHNKLFKAMMTVHVPDWKKHEISK